MVPPFARPAAEAYSDEKFFALTLLDRTAIDINNLIQSVLGLVYMDLRKYSIESRVTLGERLSTISGNEVQNEIEAISLTGAAARHRIVLETAQTGVTKLRMLLTRSIAIALCGTLLLATAGAEERPMVLKRAPGLDLVEANCGACHSLDYIAMNSPFLNRAQWEAEVSKMINTFGAPINDADAKTIVDYLIASYGEGSAQDHPPESDIMSDSAGGFRAGGRSRPVFVRPHPFVRTHAGFRRFFPARAAFAPYHRGFSVEQGCKSETVTVRTFSGVKANVIIVRC